jgi:plastocyanin
MTFLSRLTFGILLAASVTIGCSGDSSSTTPGTGGGGGGGGGTGGGGGGGGGGTGGAGLPFMAVAPCSTEAAYTTTGTTITFPVTSVDLNYSPKCLQVTAGSTVTFNGEFGSHFFAPSATRGTLTGNPMTNTSSGTTASFAFPTPGFYAYYCQFHGFDGDGSGMTGVIWVK